MSEIIKEELNKNIGKIVLIFLKNGFRYKGKLIALDNDFLKINDFKSGVEIISIDSVQQMRPGDNNDY
ncbi:MAG: LSM domain-containing protein [Candidatus Asgardarchaeia archaeon]